MTAGSIAAIILTIMGMGVIATLVNLTSESFRAGNVADHFRAVSDAAARYGRQYQASLLPLVTASSGPTITLDQLRGADCLPAQFADRNAWNQGYTIAARSDGSGGLSMVVLTTGGRSVDAAHPRFAEVQVPMAAALAKSGFVPGGLLGSTGVLRGAYGGWEVNLASMGLTAVPGHLGSLSTFSASELDSDFLYRLPIPGQPELNVMQTSLDMSDHSISGVASFQYNARAGFPADFCTGDPADEGRTFLVDSEGLYLCRDGQAVLIQDTGNSVMISGMDLGYDGMLVDKPFCPDGSGTTPQIFVAPAILSAAAEATPMASFKAWATDYSVDQWQVHLGVLSKKDEWIFPSPDYGRMVIQTSCTK
jgi:hypothetical protein